MYSQCHASGLLPPLSAQDGCVQFSAGALAVIQRYCLVPNVSMPPPRSTATPLPWLDVPGVAHR